MAVKFRLYWSSRLVSWFGSQFTGLAVPLIALRLGADASVFALLYVAQRVPAVVLGLHMGRLVDRVGPGWSIVLSDCLRALAVGGVLLGLVFDVGGLLLLAVLSFAVGALNAMESVAGQALVPILLVERSLAWGNGRIESARAIGDILGPVSAGLYVTLAGEIWALAIDLLTYLFAMALSAGLLVSTSSRGDDIGRAQKASWRFGFTVIARVPLLRGLTLTAAVFNLALGAMMALLAIFALQDLSLSSQQLGLGYAAFGVGALVGSVSASAWLGRYSMKGMMIGGTLASGIGAILLGWTTLSSPAVATLALSVCLGLIGLGIPWFQVGAATIRQTHVRSEVLGQVTGASLMVAWGAAPIGALLAGWAASPAVGVPSVIRAAGVVAIVAVGPLLLSGRRANEWVVRD